MISITFTGRLKGEMLMRWVGSYIMSSKLLAIYCLCDDVSGVINLYHF